MRLEKRPAISRTAQVVAPLGAVAFTLLITALLVLWAGKPVGQTYALLFKGGFGSVFALSETFTRAIPLMLTGLAAAVAFRARLFNIGAEGQLYAGALAAIAVGGLHGGAGFDLPTWVLFPAMMLAAALAGALLLLGPALLKAKLGVDEVVTTLLLNFIVLLGVGALLDGAMKDPAAMGWPQSVVLNPALELAKLVDQTRVHTGLIWGAVLAVGLWVLMNHTVLGFDIRAVGANPRAAAFAGVGTTRTMVMVALLSGALAGLAGAIEVAGRTSYVTLDMSPGYGYSGIVIAMLAGLHPLGVVLAVGLWVLMNHTVLGFDIRAVGANPRAAAFAGVGTTRTLVMVALLSGALAGLAGAIEVAGRTSYVTLDMSPGYGYSGIVIAMLAGLHPLGVVLASVFVAGVLVGADSMSRAMGVPTYLADVIVATSLLAVLVAMLAAQYRLRWK